MSLRQSRLTLHAEPLLAPGYGMGLVQDEIARRVLQPPNPRLWWAAFLASLGLLGLLGVSIAWLLYRGVGVWGVNIPVAWGLAIINFVWWIGIGHAGTLISAILLLLHQDWRTSINRFSEAMTLFAVMCAGLFPLLHLGRPWLFYWLLPHPNRMDLWPQWRSPLVWDVFAVGTYFTVSLLFWYLGIVPDLAGMRDRARSPRARWIYGLFALGWRGSHRHWSRYKVTYLLLAGLATPLVISVHSIVGMDFAAALVPGWHSTIFPPYFVAGAIFSGFAMVVTLLVPIRALYGLQAMITRQHFDQMGKVMLAMGLLVSYGYAAENFMAWYSGSEYEMYLARNRAFGPYGAVFWGTIACNVLSIQLLWIRRVRTSPLALFLLSLVINLGMWLERFMIVVTSLHRDYLPAAWGLYEATFWDWATFAGSFGLFSALMLLFLRFLPMISMHEMAELAEEGTAT